MSHPVNVRFQFAESAEISSPGLKSVVGRPPGRCDVLIPMKPLLIAALLLLPNLMGEVAVTSSTGRIDVTIDGKPFTSFYAGGEAPKPYLHPLTTAGGKRITRVYPMEDVAGETKDHPHHRGLWFTHGDVNGVDYWMNERSQPQGKRGIIELVKIEEAAGGASKGTIRATFAWKRPDGSPLLEERRTMRFAGGKEQRVIDFDVTFRALADVKFGDTKEGFFAIRLRDELIEKGGTGVIVNAEGRSRMKEVWGSRSPWVDYAGTLEGEKVGVAIFDHPGNPKHPTYWHARDYGLFAANPFGEHDFLNDKTRDGGLAAAKGESLRFRYRVLIHAGDAASAGIAAKYADYAAGR
jgi:hypothetical protein